MKILNSRTLPLLFLIVLSGTNLSVSAQHGGKAEGLRVRFAPGSTSATFKDTVRGSVEIDYELNGSAGQDMVVRLVTNPTDSVAIKVFGPNAKTLPMSCLAADPAEAKLLGLPTASHCFAENGKKSKVEGKTWSATLPESGNYMLSVFRPAGQRGTSTYTMTIAIAPSGKKLVGPTPSTADSAALVAAMRKLITSIKNTDVRAFLSLFSRSRFFYANNPLNEVRIAVTYSELEKDLKRKGDWYCTYLERCGDLDAFVDNIADGEMWHRVGGAKFVPPGSVADSHTYVKWRKEGSQWLIDEIAYPQT